MPYNESTCPLCGNHNACAIAQGRPAESCWCQSVTLDARALASIPEAAQGKFCICARCGQSTSINNQSAAGDAVNDE